MPNILVVEDEFEIGMAVRLLLELEGHSVQVVEHGAAALQALQKGPLPDLILLDLRMPVMNGWELLEALQRHPVWSEIPVLVTTAETGDLATNLPVLRKPFEVDELFATVRDLLRSSPANVSENRRPGHTPNPRYAAL